MCLKSLMKLRRGTWSVIYELERNYHIQSSTLGEILKGIATKRVELYRLNKAAIAGMLEEYGEYQVFADMKLEQTIVFSEVAPLTATWNGTSSNWDGTESVDYNEPSLARGQQ